MAEERKSEAVAGDLSLRVAEALGKDVGRGIARLDPKDLGRLGATVGDILAITGERPTVAKAMPAFSDSRGKGAIQIDGVTRVNAKVGLDQRVKVEKVTAVPASRIVIRPLGEIPAAKKGDDNRYLGRLLEGLPLVVGDRVRVTLFASRSQDFEIVQTSPREGCVVIHPQTEITLEAEPKKGVKPTGISYEAIGGLRKEIRRVREMIELPLRYPQLFEQLGIDAPKGVLLHGPPGTSKTLLARAVAHETEAMFISVSGPEVIHKFYGESEAKLRGPPLEIRRRERKGDSRGVQKGAPGRALHPLLRRDRRPRAGARRRRFRFGGVAAGDQPAPDRDGRRRGAQGSSDHRRHQP